MLFCPFNKEINLMLFMAHAVGMGVGIVGAGAAGVVPYVPLYRRRRRSTRRR